MGSFVKELKLKNENTRDAAKRLDGLKERLVCSRKSDAAKQVATVFILTYCKNLELFYGTELIFKTLRVGFPNANIVVVDNSSIPDARAQVEVLAKGNDCHFEQIPEPGVKHHEFIQNTIFSMAADATAAGPVVFLDPDICLWDSCEEFEFDGLIAGKLIGGFNDNITHTHTMPRLHTSFMWIPDVRKLRDEIWKLKVRYFDFQPFLPYSCAMGGVWYRYNTGASLYAAFSDRVSHFTPEHLDHYDHIFCGSHIDCLYPLYDPATRQRMTEIHRNAKEGNLHALKGIWKRQLLKDGSKWDPKGNHFLKRRSADERGSTA